MATSKAHDAKTGISFLEELSKQRIKLGEKFPEVILCYDIKNGIDVQTLREKSVHPQFKKRPLLAYGEEILETIGDDSLPCVANNALVLVLEQMEQIAFAGFEEETDFAIDDYLVDYWDTIGKKIFSWGFANTPNATNPCRC